MKILKSILYNLFSLFLYISSYALVLTLSSKLFKSFTINQNRPILYSFLAAIVIYLLNRFVKPILHHFTLPLTALTFGLFYFVNNVIILKLADLLLGNKLVFENIWVLFIISIVMSIFNFIIKKIFIKPILKGVRRK